jgi:predicted nucleic acid-binding Zn ribbon protein
VDKWKTLIGTKQQEIAIAFVPSFSPKPRSTMQKKYGTRKAEVFTMKEAVQDLLNTYRLKDRFDEAQLIASWEKIMGAPIARRTNKIFIKNKVMFIELKSAPLKHELNGSKSKVLDLFRQEFGHDIVNEVIFM